MRKGRTLRISDCSYVCILGFVEGGVVVNECGGDGGREGE